MARYRLLTFNIAHARGAMPVHQALRSPAKLRANLLKIARLIVRLGADVVALQEIDENCRWSGSFDHLEFLREHTGLPHAVHGVTNRRYGRFHLSYGNAFLSRFPVHHFEAVPFGLRTVGEKGFLFAEIDTPAGRVPFLNVHMHHRSRAVRLRQVVRLMHYLDHQRTHRRTHWRTGPVICGDLNNASHEPDATAALLGYLEEFDNYTLLPKGRFGRAAHTFPAYWPRFALDYVYLPSGCAAPQAAVMRSLLSDHRPVLVEFGLG
jgi:endonuclease/exonuclease/phosphatase family metal-dependent hydrolase